MRDSFTHKFLLTIFVAASVAGLFQLYRHVIVKSIYEMSDQGWKEMDQARAKAKGH